MREAQGRELVLPTLVGKDAISLKNEIASVCFVPRNSQ